MLDIVSHLHCADRILYDLESVPQDQQPASIVVHSATEALDQRHNALSEWAAAHDCQALPGCSMSALEVPAAIAGSVNLMAFSGALAQAGIVGRYDADRGILVIEAAKDREPPRHDCRDIAGSARPVDAWRAFQMGESAP
jgi:hypothetical protein